MNICFAYITPFHPERGGIGRVTHVLTKELQARGHNVFYLIYPSAITIRHEYNYPAPLSYLPSSELLSEENRIAYRKFLERNKIDVVINQSGNFIDSELWVKSRDINIPVISVLHSNPWLQYKHLWGTNIAPLKNNSSIEQLKRICRIILYPRIKLQLRHFRKNHFKSIIPKSDRICLLSKNYYSELDEICPGFESKFIAIPNPNSYSEKELQIKVPKRKQLIFIGLFGAQKKETLVLKIWRRIYQDFPDWNLVIIGDGPKERRERMHRLASQSERVSFTGFVNPLRYQLESSILCMTSMYEGWSMVLTESMQCGAVPILFNSYGAARDIVNDGVDGMLVRPFSLTEYESKLRRLMSDDGIRHQMSEAARKSIKRYDVKKVVDEWEKLFDEVCHK